MRSLHLVCGAALLAAGIVPLHAQADEQPGQAIDRARQVVLRLGGAFGGENPDRAALGITTGSSSRRDTLGLLIQSITANGPADKAGLQEGNRIAAINGINLKLAPADAGQPDMEGLMTRRLVRELGKVKPGDDVKLDVWADGSYKTMTIKTTKLADLEGGSWFSTESSAAANRAVIGVSWGGEPGPRDTLGLLVMSVQNDGPADKAGIQEGDRIQAINGVDVRASAADASKRSGMRSAERRFSEAMAKVKVGDPVELKVYSDGKLKTVKVTTARSGDVYKGMNENFFRFRTNDGMDGDNAMFRMRVTPMPPMPPVAPTPEAFEFAPGRQRVLELRRAQEPLIVESRVLRDRAAAMQRDANRMLQRSRTMTIMADRDGAMNGIALRSVGGMGGMGGMGDMLAFRDLRLAPVNAELASYFGAGADKGVLVLHAGGHWSQLRAGDVILSINGTAVRDGQNTNVSIDSSQETKFEVLRKGRKLTVVVK